MKKKVFNVCDIVILFKFYAIKLIYILGIVGSHLRILPDQFTHLFKLRALSFFVVLPVVVLDRGS
ncbi:MAG TPA: hypothetical protein VMV43_12950 [Candidatus Nanopelagicaceae bacterium]|nr:hypothetical protein [Candidatus Nanopelagicaceae bacterium]